MYRIVEFCCVAAVLIASVTPIPTKSNSDGVEPVVIVDFNSDIAEYQDQYEAGEVSSSSKLISIPSANVEKTLRYSIGKRVKNDRLVSHNKDNYHWPTPQNVTLILQYPTTGQGAIVTYVEVIVTQSSNIGRAYVLTGGAGQRFIVTIVEGNSTYWFNYSSKIYGI